MAYEKWMECTEQFIKALASADPTPGGGAAAAMAGAMGCSLLMMAAGTTLKRKNTPQEARPILEKALVSLQEPLGNLNSFVKQDAYAYEEYIKATRLPQTDFAREALMQEALWKAACVPANTAKVCQQVLHQTDTLAPLIDKIIISDVICGRHLLHCAIDCCAENIRANLTYITDSKHAEKLSGFLQTLQVH